MASTGILQRRDLKANLISGIPSDINYGWSGQVAIGEFVFATDFKEIGFVDSTDTLVWRDIDDFGNSISTIEDLSNVDVTGLTDTNILQYDSATSSWKPVASTLSITELTDVDTATVAPTDTQTLVWDNANSLWKPGTIDTGDTSSGLEAIDDGNGIGWRLIGTDPLNYGNIGLNSIDFSYSSGSSNIFGPTQSNSFTIGYNTIASGKMAFAGGYTTVASGDRSFAGGGGTVASGDASFTYGTDNIASATNSTTFGQGINAINNASFALGSFNVGTDINTILEVGIGTSDSIRANGLEVYLDGTATLPEATPAEITNRGDQAIATVGYVNTVAGGGGGGSSTPLDIEIAFANITNMLYDVNNYLTKTVYAAFESYNAGYTSNYTYGSNNNLDTLIIKNDVAVVVLTVTYGYDANNNLITVTRT